MDIKLQTFLTLCELMNYRLTAEQLNLTQPAVTKQIQSLENEYNTKLFIYDKRRLTKTDSCKLLESYAQSMRYNYNELQKAFSKESYKILRVGATKTIGDYVICDAIERYLLNSDNHISLIIDNTTRLLDMLKKNLIDFAIVEGIFPKKNYDFRLLKNENFIGICSASHPFCGKTIPLADIFSQSVIVREKGSGTRNIFERELSANGYSIDTFAHISEISSFKLICRLVSAGIGISFVYEAVYKSFPQLGCFNISEFSPTHEYNTVFLKNTKASQLADSFLTQCHLDAVDNQNT